MKLGLTVPAAALVLAALSPMPAAAREAGLSQMAQKLNDPKMQSGLAAALTALSDALLDMKVAPFAKAMESMGDKASAREMDPNTTLRDLAGDDGAQVQSEIADKIPMMMGAMAGMAGSMEAMLPELKAMGKQMEGKLKRLPIPQD